MQTIEEIKTLVKKMPRTSWNGMFYHPLQPCGDSDSLAALGRRLIVYHGSATSPQTVLHFAARGIVHSGVVIGITND